MTVRATAVRWSLLVMWLIVGVAVWNGVYDLYVSRGAREYLQLAAEAELGRRPVPVMADVMASNFRAGRNSWAASSYFLLIVAASVVTNVRGSPASADRIGSNGTIDVRASREIVASMRVSRYPAAESVRLSRGGP